MLRCTAPERRDVPTPRGFALTDGEWRCDVEAYREFIEAAVGTTPPAEFAADDCYVVGTRLEGFIEQRRIDGEWSEELSARYPDVESLEQIEALALFLRTCEADYR